MVPPGRNRGNLDYSAGKANENGVTGSSWSIGGIIKEMRNAKASHACKLCACLLVLLLQCERTNPADAPQRYQYLRYANLRSPPVRISGDTNERFPTQVRSPIRINSRESEQHRLYHNSWNPTSVGRNAPTVQVTARPTTRTNRFAQRNIPGSRSSFTSSRAYKRTSMQSIVRRLQDQINAHQKSLGHSKKRNRRMWQHIMKTKEEVRKLQTTCTDITRNVSTTNGKLRRFTGEFHSHQADARERMEQIEDHQTTQDDRHFQVYEQARNISGAISQLQAEVADMTERIADIADTTETNGGQAKSTSDDISIREEIADVRNEMSQQYSTFTDFRDEVNAEIERIDNEKQALSREVTTSHKHLRERFNGQLNHVTSSIDEVTEVLETHGEQIRELRTADTGIQEEVDVATSERRNMDVRIGRNEDSIRVLRQRTPEDLTAKIEMKTRSLVSRQAGNFAFAINALNTSVRTNQYQVGSCASRIEVVEEDLRALTSRVDGLSNGRSEIRPNLGATIQRNIKFHYNVSTTSGPLHWNNLRQVLMGRPGFVQRHGTSRTVTSREIMAMMAQSGVQERLDQISRTLRHYNRRLMNVTSLVQTMSGDVRSLSMATAHYFNVINVQARIIRKQNETIAWLTNKQQRQDATMRGMASDLENEHETVMKLTTIVINLGRLLRWPISQSRDCHDLWMSGHRESGVYTIVRDMATKPIYCNMTSSAGWTVLQRRRDGTQDFDREWAEYKNGFGSLYGEFWLGLDDIRYMTHGRSYSLMVMIEDWKGNTKYAMYDQFVVFGQNFVLSIAGYSGGAGDMMSLSNDRPFQVRMEGRDRTITSESSCTNTRRSGWWFPADCGEANPNGPYRSNMKSTEDEDEMTSNDPSLMLFWMAWQAEANPIRKLSLQIVPREALVEEVFSVGEERENEEEEAETEEETFEADPGSEGGITTNELDDVDQYQEYDRQGERWVTVQSP